MPPQTISALRARLFHLAWPVLIAQAAVMANGVIDTLMAGRLSPADLAAVGIGASIYAIVFVAAMGVLLALSPIVAHHYGAGRLLEIGADVRQSAWLGLVLSIAGVILLQHPALFLDLAQPPPEVADKVRAYLAGCAWAVPGALFFRIFYGLASGIGRPRPVMVFQLFGLALKIPLNMLFMYGSIELWGLPAIGNMGAAGAGWSTALISWLLAIAAWAWCRRAPDFAPYAIFTRIDPPRWPLIRELLALGLPIGAAFLIDVTAFTFMALFIARLGTETSAAHQIAVSIAIFAFMIPIAIGHATGIMTGQALGAGDTATARAAGWLGLGTGASVALLTALGMIVLAPQLAAAYSPDPAVRQIAAGLLLIAAAHHIADALQTVLAQILRGYKRAAVPMAIYVISLWGVGLGGGYLAAFTEHLGPAKGAPGFWWSAVVALSLAALLLGLYFERISRHPAK